MNLLLDTHVFLWFLLDDSRLPEPFRQAIKFEENRVYLSVVSVWETAIKQQLGKLPLPGPAAVYLPEARRRHHIEPLPLNEIDVTALTNLPSLHRDPFDRMLIAQSLHHSLKIVTVDPMMKRYPIQYLPG
jgi:PIN domain nuclease of toxin-antitoxin system